ncbi:MAG TPA: hypothetical protein G4O15_10100 [Dehalococcoidia bacterium]|nr:hypothetical protein [Dehalococcoidia bacterium]
MECSLEKNIDNCPCTYSSCSRKGKCCECISYHLKHEELPACAFSQEVEKTYDRSFGRFVSEYQTKH